jgi:general secretion pathway protein G
MIKKPNVGYTLIELLVVISIIAILSSLAMVAYQASRKSARDGRRKADLEQIRSALEMYRSDKGSYPTSLTAGGSIGVYMTFPGDPLTNQLYSYTPSLDVNNSAVSYSLCAALETSSGSTSCSNCGSGISCTYQVRNP